MFKNYLIHKEKKYFRGQYKTPTTAEKWGKVDLTRFCEKLKTLNKEDKKSYIVIEYNGQTIATIKQN